MAGAREVHFQFHFQNPLDGMEMWFATLDEAIARARTYIGVEDTWTDAAVILITIYRSQEVAIVSGATDPAVQSRTNHEEPIDGSKAAQGGKKYRNERISCGIRSNVPWKSLIPKNSMTFRLNYKESPERYLVAHHVHTWKSDDVEMQQGMTVGSSGPKDYLKNRIISAFSQSHAETITMLVYNQVPFLILRVGGKYFDVLGKEVEVQQ